MKNTMETVCELLAETKRMRTLQKEYFKNRSRTVLEESKQSERKVDKLLTELGMLLDQEPKLKQESEQKTLF
jgi:hypothetical protein